MRRFRFAIGVKFLVVAAVAVTVSGFVVMSLWNWLAPDIFGWHTIRFGQAIGLLALSRILFGGFRGMPGRGMHWRNRMRQRWERMSPEEREKLRAGLKERCGPFRTPEPKVEM